MVPNNVDGGSRYAELFEGSIWILEGLEFGACGRQVPLKWLKEHLPQRNLQCKGK